MILHFDSKQSYQLETIKTIVDLVEGQPLGPNEFEVSFQHSSSSTLFTDRGFGNNLLLTEKDILNNLQQVQELNDIEISERLEKISYKEIKEDSSEKIINTEFPNFTIEMETGTGKTYVYLRTIYELNKVYGFKKFVIVVPGIAIREGVLKNLKITHEHFQSLYGRPPVNFNVYDSRRLPLLKSFASSNSIQILIINIDSFAKDTNVINQYRDTSQGKKPIEFIQAIRPIVILDEPQNMETDIRKKGVANLNPLFALRFSATHKNIYNLVYKLDPVKAYDLGLVKQIEVDSVYTENDFNRAFILIENIKATKSKLYATIKIDVNSDSGVKRKSIKVDSKNYDLYKLSNNREQYKDILISSINADAGFIELSNGDLIYKGESHGALKDQIMKIQLQKAVEEHFIKEKLLNQQGIKVLSLFFIDRVANYREYDDQGNTIKGKFAKWFEEEFEKYQKKFPKVIPFKSESVHNGYFAQDRKGIFKDTSGETKADDDTYQLIMKDKEKLLDINEPLRFIFSHSALREGWDNPNVFQICTLNETSSEMKKRQEIGRGLRLCVNQDGQRVLDKGINRLTIIANESYEDFAATLQKEIETECGVNFTGRIKDKRNRKQVKIKKGFELDKNFLDLWERIKHKTKYSVEYDTEVLIKKSIAAIKQMIEVKAPLIRTLKTSMQITKEKIGGQQKNFGVYQIEDINNEIPDVLGYLQNKTNLTRSTIHKIILESGRLKDILINPQLFLDQASNEIKKVLIELMIDGIKYEKIGNTEYYTMESFQTEEIESYIENLLKVKNQDKTLYNYINFDSNVEEQFAKDCESNDKVEFYIKLPAWFKINTPIGSYNPDWALIFKNDKKIYFVAETKYSLDPVKRYTEENYKIKCGEKHFEAFEDVVYKPVKKLTDLL